MEQPFSDRNLSLRARGSSFGYAFEGLRSFFRSEPNAWIHLLATILVFVLMLLLPMKPVEIILILIVTGMVWCAELFNTAIEKMADLITKERHPSIKFIKDIAAGAVLVGALTAFITGGIIFIPKIIALWT
jgi:diacylglycerol kinase (ATP)